jgi:hypothetical protein
MPRSNRPRRPKGRRDEAEVESSDLSRVLYGGQHIEAKRGRDYTVQAIAGTSSAKPYVCPSCASTIEPGTPHLVVWRADGLFGDEADLAARRHWHTHCWRIF